MTAEDRSGRFARDAFDLAAQQEWRVFYSADHVAGSRVDPWNFELRGPRGSTIYAASDRELCAYTCRRGLWKRLEALGRVTQRGDFELTVRFSADQLAEVAGLLQVYRKRVLSLEQRARLTESRRRFREQAGNPVEPCSWGAKASGSDNLIEDEGYTLPESDAQKTVEKEPADKDNLEFEEGGSRVLRMS